MAEEIRPATINDAEAFVSAYERAWDAAIAPLVGSRLEQLAPLGARLEGYRASFERFSGDAGALLADRGGEVVGIATHADGELRALYVVPEAWGTGAASALAAAALDAIRRSGHDVAFLWVGENNSRARRFYEREGWTTDGERRADSTFGLTELRYVRNVA